MPGKEVTLDGAVTGIPPTEPYIRAFLRRDPPVTRGVAIDGYFFPGRIERIAALCQLVDGLPEWHTVVRPPGRTVTRATAGPPGTFMVTQGAPPSGGRFGDRCQRITHSSRASAPCQECCAHDVSAMENQPAQVPLATVVIQLAAGLPSHFGYSECAASSDAWGTLMSQPHSPTNRRRLMVRI